MFEAIFKIFSASFNKIFENETLPVYELTRSVAAPFPCACNTTRRIPPISSTRLSTIPADQCFSYVEPLLWPRAANELRSRQRSRKIRARIHLQHLRAISEPEQRQQRRRFETLRPRAQNPSRSPQSEPLFQQRERVVIRRRAPSPSLIQEGRRPQGFVFSVQVHEQARQGERAFLDLRPWCWGGHDRRCGWSCHCAGDGSA